jgi:hypothetical protein
MAATERESKEGQPVGAGEDSPGTGDEHVIVCRMAYYDNGVEVSPPSHDDD